MRHFNLACLLLLGSALLAGCSSSPYESSDWSSNSELRQEQLDALIAQSGEHMTDRHDPSRDARLLRSDSVSPLKAASITGALQAVADELAEEWTGSSCGCQVVIGPKYSFGAFTYPNGTIVVQAGTLTYLDTQDELAALLAHELSHLWLNHHQKNELQSATKGVTDLAQAISIFGNDDKARETTLRMGGSTDALVAAAGFTQWNRQQETEADLLAAKILEQSRYSPMAMIALLTKLRNGQDDIVVAGSDYEEMAEVASKKIRKEDVEISDGQIQKWLSTVSDDMDGREYLSSEERRQIVRVVIYGLESGTLARSFTDLPYDPEVLAPITNLRAIRELEPGSPDYFEVVEQALSVEPDNLHIQLIEFRGLVTQRDPSKAAKLAIAFIRNDRATFRALSEATRFLDQYPGLDASERQALMQEAVNKLSELDLPEMYVADQYYLAKRYKVPVQDVLNEKLCTARSGNVEIRERCKVAEQAIERDRSFYRLLAGNSR